MKAMTSEQLAKLPKFAQAEINELRRELERLKAKNDWLEQDNRVKVDQSNTVVVQGYKDDTALTPFSRVSFSVNKSEGAHERWKSAIEVRVRPDEESVEVSGSDSIMLSPQASNVVIITLRKP